MDLESEKELASEKELPEEVDATAEAETDAELGTAEDVGDIRLADEVICIVAALAAQEVPGVLAMSSGLADGLNKMLGKESAAQGVRCAFSGNLVQLSVYLIVEYGCCIPEIALTVQEKVKEAVEAMTGYAIERVDIHVEGVGRAKHTDLRAIDEAAKVQEEELEEAEAAAEKTAFLDAAEEPDVDEGLAKRHAMFFEEDQ